MKVKNIPVEALQARLIDQKATLFYFTDVEYTSPHFKLVQNLGLKGYLPEWEARLNDVVTKEDLAGWRYLSNLKLEDVEVGKTTRVTVLQKIYDANKW